jgi:hypothetical protein
MAYLMTRLRRACRGARLGLLVLALSVAAALPTEAGSVTYDWSWGPEGQQTVFPDFDISYGVLTQVTVSGTASGAASFNYIPQMSFTNGTYNYSISLTADNFGEVFSSGGSGTFAGTDGVATLDATTSFTTNVPTADFLPIPGNSLVDTGFQVGFSFDITSPDITGIFGVISTDGSGTVTYYYFVPEPSSLTMGSMAVAVGLGYWWGGRTGALRRSRRVKGNTYSSFPPL